MGAPIGPVELILILVYLFFVFLFWKIFNKAGFPGWYGIFVIIPGFILIALIILAFSKWPIHKT